MKCQRCGASLLWSQATAGSPPRPFWVTLEDGHLGFDCPAGPGGHSPEHQRPRRRTMLARLVAVVRTVLPGAR